MKGRNKILIIVAAVFVVAAIAFLIAGFYLAGNDVLAWFNSKWAWLFYIMFGTYFLFILFIWAIERIKKI